MFRPIYFPGLRVFVSALTPLFNVYMEVFFFAHWVWIDSHDRYMHKWVWFIQPIIVHIYLELWNLSSLRLNYLSFSLYEYNYIPDSNEVSRSTALIFVHPILGEQTSMQGSSFIKRNIELYDFRIDLHSISL